MSGEITPGQVVSGEIVPRESYVPAVPASDGDLPSIPDSNLGFLSLGLAVAALAAQALRLKEKVWALQALFRRNTDKASNMSEMCDAAEVEPQFTALIMEGATSLREVAEASGDMVNAADEMQMDAQGFNDAHQGEYGGIYEVVQSMGVQQPKPGFNEVK
ncbi:conjugal transfer protein TraB [Wenjunlia tyrosinilytica]|uniref:Plasmid transfer protein TraB n=1 Tax=Wenjunlia tyrosinilytica TaxID=1544741 RepID=A0A918E269_9ACTN|nr:conjugal transfer protein TraB [Wenjunlia tyrosinilytica]GGO98382.1 plasmid transfer protein TraB [Wenjunlia tyrosinilytica]